MSKTPVHTSLKDIELISIPVVHDRRGNLAFLEQDLPGFRFKRVYYLFDIPAGARRGGHAHKEQWEMLVALSGSFDVILDDGKNRRTYRLNRPDRGLVIPPGIWRELENFSANAICMVFNSASFDEADYIRDFHQFGKFKRNKFV